MTKHPADERLEADLAIAEETLLNVGHVMPSFIIMAPKKRLLVPAPADDPDTKAIYYSLVRLLCYAENAFAITQVAECWMRWEGWRNDQSIEENAERVRKIRPSQAPDRREALMAATCYRGADRQLALALRIREIIRTADGRPTGTRSAAIPEDAIPYEAALTHLLPPALFSADQQQAARLELTKAQLATGIFLQQTILPDFSRP
jgi:hypothetical protein